MSQQQTPTPAAPVDEDMTTALVREVDHYRDLLADAYVTIGCAVESEDGLDGSEADRFQAAVRRLWPAAVDHPTIAKWLALPEEGTPEADATLARRPVPSEPTREGEALVEALEAKKYPPPLAYDQSIWNAAINTAVEVVKNATLGGHS